MPLTRIGYVVFEMAADASKLLRTYKENETFMALFESD
jgi:hypothetical protein